MPNILFPLFIMLLSINSLNFSHVNDSHSFLHNISKKDHEFFVNSEKDRKILGIFFVGQNASSEMLESMKKIQSKHSELNFLEVYLGEEGVMDRYKFILETISLSQDSICLVIMNWTDFSQTREPLVNIQGNDLDHFNFNDWAHENNYIHGRGNHNIKSHSYHIERESDNSRESYTVREEHGSFRSNHIIRTENHGHHHDYNR